MDAIIKVNLDNSAFEDAAGVELARILRKLAEDLETGFLPIGNEKSLRDSNGNRVGNIVFTVE